MSTEEGVGIDKIEQFFGCYLLVSLNPRYQGHTYIGFTVDPNRREGQHNGGVKKGGARRTSGKDPWDMSLIIYGFPNEISALKFEWAWQHPHDSRRLRHVKHKTSKENRFEYRVRVAAEMLQVAPWHRMPLTWRWLRQERAVLLPPRLAPPQHVPIVYGPVTSLRPSRKPKKAGTDISREVLEEASKSEIVGSCGICDKEVLRSSAVWCYATCCRRCFHLRCLAAEFLQQEAGSSELLPITGRCVCCDAQLLWGELIRARRGAYSSLLQPQNVPETGAERGSSSPEHWSTQLRVHTEPT